MYFCGKKYWSKFYRFQRSKPVPPRLAGIEVKNAAPKMPVVPPGNLCIHILSLWHYFNIFIYIISIYKIYIYACFQILLSLAVYVYYIFVCIIHSSIHLFQPALWRTDWLTLGTVIDIPETPVAPRQSALKRSRSKQTVPAHAVPAKPVIPDQDWENS